MSSLVRGAIRPLSIATGHPFHAREPATQTPLIGWNPMARRTDPGGGPTRVTKAERKEQARRERLELMRKQAKRRTRRRIGIVLGSILVAGAVVAIVLANLGGGTTKKNNGGLDPKSLPGMLQTQATAANPWPANSQDAQARAAKIGLPPVGGAFHNHNLLDIRINGEKIPVPADIGITGSLVASMHTHDASGIMHMESNRQFDFTLGDFFNVWGVLLTPDCIGGYCNSGPDVLRVYVNGKQVTTDVTKLPLTQHEYILVTYGTTAQLPSPIPSTYSKNISSSCAGSC